VRLLLVGPPGSGKGTQAGRIGNHYGIAHISSGELLRRQVELDTPIGRAVREKLTRGDLVPDGIVMDLLRRPVETATRQGGYVLDGFPRTVEQAEIAYAVAKDLGVEVQVAVHLDVPTDELVRRLLARGRGADDTKEVIEHRLAVYDERTRPMLDFYGERESVVTIDGAQPIDAVTVDLLGRLEQRRREALV